MVTLLGRTWRRDWVVVVDQLGIPLIGSAAHEAVEPFEASRERPMSLRGGKIGLLERREMPFADAVGVVSVVGEHLREQSRFIGNAAVSVRETIGELLDGRHSNRRGVATGEQRCPCR